MSTSSAGRMGTPSTARKGKEFNEFAQIEGLGPAMRQWLSQSFDVQTVEDLARLSVNRVLSNPTLSQLKDAEKAVCCRKLDGWIKQAQEFVVQRTSWHTFTTFVVALQTRQVSGQTEQRTTAYCLETGQSVAWSGIECDALCEMMLDQFKQNCQLQPKVSVLTEPQTGTQGELVEDSSLESELDVQETSINQELVSDLCLNQIAKTSLETEPIDSQEVTDVFPTLKFQDVFEEELLTSQSEKSITEVVSLPKTEDIQTEINISRWSAKIRITDVKIFQPSYTDKPIKIDIVNHMLLSSLHKGEPFDLEVAFQLLGQEVDELTKQLLPYHLEVYIQNHTTGDSLMLASIPTSTLIAGALNYTCNLTGITLNETSLYRFQIIVRINRGYVSPGFIELPFVQVI